MQLHHLTAELLFLALAIATAQGNSLANHGISGRSFTGGSVEGRGFFDNGILQTLAKFLGFANDSPKSQDSPIERRPEMLPFELAYPQNRRSGFIGTQGPNHVGIDDNMNKVGTAKTTKQKSVWRKGKNVLAKYFGFGRSHNHKQYKHPNYKPPYPRNEKSYTQFKRGITHKHKRFNVPNLPKKTTHLKYVQQPSSVKKTTVQSHKPLVAIHNVGNAQQKYTNGKLFKNKTNNIYHQIAEEKYLSSLKNKVPTPTPVKIHSTKEMGLSKFGALRDQKRSNIDGSKIDAHPYPFLNPGHTKGTQPKVVYDPNPLVNQRYEPRPMFSSQIPRRPYQPHQESSKKKGIFENMKSIANNFFSNFLSKSPSTPPSTRRNQELRPQFQSSNFINQDSTKSFSSTNKNDFLAPSPQQGMIAEDAFQPIFVPSQSMDGKLSKNSMKPIIIPQRRKDDAVSETPKEPQLIDFF